MDKQTKLGSPAGQAEPAANEPTIQEIRNWDAEGLLQWIQQKKPTLLSGNTLKKFRAVFISGNAFLDHAGDADWFQINCKLPPGISYDLADLARETKKSRFSCIHHTHHADS